MPSLSTIPKHTLLFSLLIAILFSLTYFILSTHQKLSISKKLIEKGIPFSVNTNDRSKTLLVLGDSTAVGVGASTPEESVPGRLAAYRKYTSVENHAVSGATVSDLPSQIQQIQQNHYDTILVQIGANDMTRFHDEEQVAASLKEILLPLKEKSKEIILISAGNLGGARAIPYPLRPLATRVNKKYHKAFEDMAKVAGINYINLYTDPHSDPFILEPNVYFAADSFHPSSAGYGVWFDIIKKNLREEAQKEPDTFTYKNASSDLITVDLPYPGAVIGNTFSVTGKARGTWYFEASFPISVVDEKGLVIATSVAQAGSDWMTTEFVPFKASVTTPENFNGKATLILNNDNPSGIKEKSMSVALPIIIKK